MKNLKLNHLSQARLNVTIFSLSLLDLFFFILHTLLYKCFCFVCSSLSFVRPRYCRFYLACIYLNRKFTFSLFLWIFSSLFISYIYHGLVQLHTEQIERGLDGVVQRKSKCKSTKAQKHKSTNSNNFDFRHSMH